jgi:hypothetical protein
MSTDKKPNVPTLSDKALAWLQRNAGKSIAIGFALYVSALALVHYAPTPAWLTAARGFAIEHLGQLGDSFGPLTAIFAAIAAVGAWKSYGAQRQQLLDERQRHRGTRFDETFFRLLDHYDRELSRLHVRVPMGHSAFAQPGERKGWDAISVFKRTVKIFQFDDQRLGKDTDAFAWGFTHKFFKPLALLRDPEVAITRWLKRQSKGVLVDIRGALLVAKLSDEELWFWYYAVLSTGDTDLITLASKLGIERKRAVDDDRPKPETDSQAPTDTIS